MAVETLTLVKGKDKLELPQQNGNWVLARELGYSPVQMLVTAAAAVAVMCILLFWKILMCLLRLKNRSQLYERFYEESRADLFDPDQFYARISAEYQEKAIRCLKLVSPNCPVIQSLDPTITVAETVHFI